MPRPEQHHVEAGSACRSMMNVNLFLMILVASPFSASALAQWTQWGGPQRDFTAPSGVLSLDWPESGPADLSAAAQSLSFLPL